MVAHRAIAHKTFGHRMTAHRAIAHKPFAHRMFAHKTIAHRTLAHWNQREAAADGLARTTNIVEGWHHSLQVLNAVQSSYIVEIPVTTHERLFEAESIISAGINRYRTTSRETLSHPSRSRYEGCSHLWRKVHKYNLRMRPHNLTLPPKDDRNFIARQLYKNICRFLTLACKLDCTFVSLRYLIND